MIRREVGCCLIGLVWLLGGCGGRLPQVESGELDAWRPAAGAGVVALVDVQAPRWVPHFYISRQFRKAVPQYRVIDGLVRKYFTIAPSNRVGGIYLFADRASARAFFDDAWHRRIREKYDEDGRVRLFELDAVLEPKRRDLPAAEGDMVALVVDADAASESATDLARAQGLLRAYSIHADDHRQLVTIWNGRSAVDRYIATRGGLDDDPLEQMEAPVVITGSAYR